MRAHAALWDWIFHHHLLLIVALVIAGPIAVFAARAVQQRRVLQLAILGVLSAVAVIAILVAGWVLADQRSNDRDIARRVDEIVHRLPAAADQTAQSSGANYRSRTFRVSGSPQAVAQPLYRSLSDIDGRIYRSGTGNDIEVAVSFSGRNGCDGTVEVAVSLTPAKTGGTSADVGGHCED